LRYSWRSSRPAFEEPRFFRSPSNPDLGEDAFTKPRYPPRVISHLLVVELAPDPDRIPFILDHGGGRYVGDLREGMPEWDAARPRTKHRDPV
jgi:hypothetical protein